jgi:phage shock protein B
MDMGCAIFPGIFLVAALAIMMPVMIVAMVLRHGKSKGGAMSADELRLVQEIHNGLARMDSRIEALEAILIDRMKVKQD